MTSPQMMPSMVRPERRRLRSRESMLWRMISRRFMAIRSSGIPWGSGWRRGGLDRCRRRA